MSRIKSNMMNSQEDNNQEEEVDNQASEVQYELCELMSKFPTEITFEILSRLPARNLSHCRWLSKAWYYTINNPSFITIQHSKLIKNKSPCVFLKGRTDSQAHGVYYLIDHESLDSNVISAIPFTPRLPIPLKQIRKIYSSNGLILVDAFLNWMFINSFYVCNPITGEHNQIPKPNWADTQTRFVYNPDIPEPREQTCFILDPATGVFKVISTNDSNAIQVYSSRVGKWRITEKSTFRLPPQDDVLQNIFVNGALHWLGSSSEASPSITSLRFDTEEFKLIPLPHGLDLSKAKCRYLVVLGDCLCLATEFSNKHVEIWVMKEYGLQSSWDKKYTILHLTIYRPITLMPNGEILTMRQRWGEFGFYNLETKVFRSINLGVDYIREVSVTVSSLIPPSARSIVN